MTQRHFQSLSLPAEQKTLLLVAPEEHGANCHHQARTELSSVLGKAWQH